MTVWNRVAAFATLTVGTFGLVGVSAPVNATQASSGAIVGDPPALTMILPTTGARVDAPTVDTAVANPTDAIDDAPTGLDAADVNDGKFESLAAAVAGQGLPSDLSNELRCLAGAVYYESKGEPLAGQLAVAEVIMNRARSGRYPRSLCGVVTQAGQFSFVRGGVIPAINPGSSQWKTAVAVAQVALDEAWQSPASKALFFHARYVSPSWGKARVASIGNHVFYR